MKTVVVTGPVCGGKSTLAALLAEQGAVVIDGDALGHAVLTITEVRAALVAAFGVGVTREGEIDRAELGRRVFQDADALASLNRITHPVLAMMIEDRLALLAEGATTSLAVLDAAVYFLLPIHQPVDLVVTVTADPRTRLQRLLRRNHLTPAEAESRIRAQAALARDWSRADLVVVNDQGREVLARAVVDIMQRTGLSGGHENSGLNEP